MNENSTGKMRDRTNLKRLDSLTDEEIEQAAQSDADTLLLEECDMASLEVVISERKQSISLRVDSDLIDGTIEVHTPRRYEITGKVDGHMIKKIGRLEATQQIEVTPYSSRWVTGYVSELPENNSVIFLPKKTTSELEGQDVFVVPECTSPEDLSQKSLRGEISWLRPKSRRAKEVTINEARAICQRIRNSWREKFKFQEEVRDATGVIQLGLRPPQIGALHAALAHWSVSTKPATIVMPTGTGKTETMLALMVAVRSRLKTIFFHLIRLSSKWIMAI